MEWRAHIARYGDAWFPGERWVRWTFALLLLVGAVLRFWNLPYLPFTHDELSALSRLYPTLTETIQRGVIELDTHPPGVQVFEWIWTRLFGTDEGVVKLPFILMALIALFLLYRTALAWTSAGATLLGISLLATLQYTVLYAQIARPYAAGFFTIALLADQLTRYVATGRKLNLLGIGVAAVLSAYTHHFALLLAGIIVLSGLVLLSATQRKRYWIMCGCAALAYVPNIPIFLRQLGLGGLDGWLQPPGADWLPTYTAWILHYSTVLLVLASAVLVFLWSRSLRHKWTTSPANVLFPLWGLSPLIIGMAYSIWRSPVLQYSMLIFGFPFLLFWIFSAARHASPKLVVALVVLLSSVGSVTLVAERQHYRVFSDSPYAAMVRVAHDAVSQHGAERTLVLFDAPKPQVQFHVDRSGLSDRADIVWVRDLGEPEALDDVLHRPGITTVVLGTTNGGREEHFARVQAEFPHTIQLEDHVEGQVRVFSATPSANMVQDRRLVRELDPGKRGSWAEIDPSIGTVHDSTTNTSSWEFSGREYGIVMHLDLGHRTTDVADIYEAELMVSHAEPNADVAVVLELQQGDSTLIYRASAARFLDDTAYAVVALSPGWTHISPDPLRLKMYIHDRTRSNVRVHRLRIYRRDHNPVQDALMQPVHHLGHLPK